MWVMIIFAAAMGILALIASAALGVQLKLWSKYILDIRNLREEVDALTAELEALKSGGMPAMPVELPPLPEPEPEPLPMPEPVLEPEPEPLPPPVLEKVLSPSDIFVNEFNQLMEGEIDPMACIEFFTNKNLIGLNHEPGEMGEGGELIFRLHPGTSSMEGRYWAWVDESNPVRHYIVPCPLFPYDEDAHERGGMKETFATDYEDGSYSHVSVRLPAIMVKKSGHWVVDQPGIVRLVR